MQTEKKRKKIINTKYRSEELKTMIKKEKSIESRALKIHFLKIFEAAVVHMVFKVRFSEFLKSSQLTNERYMSPQSSEVTPQVF